MDKNRVVRFIGSIFLSLTLANPSLGQDAYSIDRALYIAALNKRTNEYTCRVEADGDNKTLLKFTCPKKNIWKVTEAFAYDETTRREAKALGFVKLAFNNEERDVLYIDLYDPIQALPSKQSSPGNSDIESQSAIAQLIEIRNVFSSIFSMKALARHHSSSAPIALESVRVEPMYIGSSYSVREGSASIQFRNLNSNLIIANTEWRIDIYDQSRRTSVDTFYLSSKKRVEPGKKGLAENDLGRLKLPYSPAALAQLTKVTYTNGTTWIPSEECIANQTVSDIVCQGKSNSAAANAATSQQSNQPSAGEASPTEIAFWESIKNSDNAEDFKAYLDKYPNGAFASLARIRVQKLKKP